MIKQLKEDIEAVFARDPAARNTLEVLTTYPGIHAAQHAYCLHLVALLQESKFILVQKLVNGSLLIMVWVS